jgi:allophanate hydrolase subunit 1
MTLQKISDEQTSLIMEYDDNFNIDELSDTDMISIIEKISAEIKNKQKIQNNDVKIPVVIDLRLYGPDLYIPVYVDDVQYSLTDTQRFNIKKSWTKVNI